MTEPFNKSGTLYMSMGEKDKKINIPRRLNYLDLYVSEHPIDELSQKIKDFDKENLNLDELRRLYSLAKNIRKKEREEKEARYKSEWEDYKFNINSEDAEPFEPNFAAFDVTLITRDSQEYWANFITRKYLDYLFEKNKKTGECVSGTYFYMPNMIVVEEITEDSVKATIDDFIKGHSIKDFFSFREED